MLRRGSKSRLLGLAVAALVVGGLVLITSARSNDPADQAAPTQAECAAGSADCERSSVSIAPQSTTSPVTVTSIQPPTTPAPTSQAIDESIFRFVADADCSIPGVVETTHCQPENDGANLIDYDFDTRWSAQNDAVVRLDLAVEEQVLDAGIAWHHGDERTATFAIAVSTDGLSWTPVGDERTSSGTTTEFQRIPIDMPARYIAIAAYGNSDEDGSWNSITEIDINTSFEAVSGS